MDNIGCQGTENKLIECGYHTDTSEDSHSGDIWIDCRFPNNGSSSGGTALEARTNASLALPNAALALAVVTLIVFIIMSIALVICTKQSSIRQKMKWVDSH